MTNRTPFGYKTGWIAARTSDGRALLNALEVFDSKPMDWEKGVAAAYTRGVFVAPDVDGWTLAMGEALNDPANRVAPLSAALGVEVQAFASHRVVDLQSWARAVDGATIRHFTYVGDQGLVFSNSGVPTPEEENLGLEILSVIEPGEIPEDMLEHLPDESIVMELAGLWSLNPTTIEGHDDRHGWYGSLSGVHPPPTVAPTPGFLSRWLRR